MAVTGSTRILLNTLRGKKQARQRIDSNFPRRGEFTTMVMNQERSGNHNYNNRIARRYDRDANERLTPMFGIGNMSRGTSNSFHSIARAIRHNSATNNYDYTQPGNYSHDARYRNIRRAFGMSAG